MPAELQTPVEPNEECVACSTTDGWSQRDAPLLQLLRDLGALPLATTLTLDVTLAGCVEVLQDGGRVPLLAMLKEKGIKVLTDRQKICNGIAKGLRTGTLPSTSAERPEQPPPTCDKCDGPHRTDACPHFTKAREDHVDSKRSPKKSARPARVGKDPSCAEARPRMTRAETHAISPSERERVSSQAYLGRP